MAAMLAQPSFGLQAPTNDDNMEISSYQGDTDGDIDIDLDSAGEQMHYEDDDQMLDDDAAHHHDDELMVDDDAASLTADREMHVDNLATTVAFNPTPQVPEDGLFDFSDDEDMHPDPDANAQPSVPAVEPPLDTSAPLHSMSDSVQSSTLESSTSHVDNEPVEQVQSEIAAELLTEGVQVIDHTSEEQEAVDATLTHEADEEPRQADDVSSGAVKDAHAKAVQSDDAASNHDSQDACAEASSVTESVENPSGTIGESVQHDSTTTAIEASLSQAAEPDSTETSVDQEAFEVPDDPTTLTEEVQTTNVDVTDKAGSRERQANSPTVTGLHPTVVEYDGNEILLFPSSDTSASEPYLLTNENLVTSSLGDLLQACRSVLQSLSEDDELVLGVEELDLYVSEDSTPAFSISFSELLDVYLQLHKHDGNVNPPPFRVSLTTKTRFTNRLNLITQAIAEGKGFSQLDFLHNYEFDEAAGFPEEEDFEDESYHEIDVSREQDNIGEDPAQEGHIEGQNQEQEQQFHEEHDDYADNDESEYTADHAEGRAEAFESEVPATNAQDVQDFTQDGNPEAGQLSENTDEQQNESLPATAQSTAEIDLYGEDALLNFYKEEDSGLMQDSASDNEGVNTLDNAGEAYPEEDAEQAIAQTYDETFDENYFQEEEAAFREGEATYDDETQDHGADEQEAANPAEVADDEAVETANAPMAPLEPGTGQDAHVSTNEGTTERIAGETFEEGGGPSESSALLQTDHHGEDDSQTGATSVLNAKSTAAYDDDEIDFDEDDFAHEQSPAPEATPKAAAIETSPSVKRSFSERNEAGDVSQDEQTLKKARSS